MGCLNKFTFPIMALGLASSIAVLPNSSAAASIAKPAALSPAAISPETLIAQDNLRQLNLNRDNSLTDEQTE